MFEATTELSGYFIWPVYEVTTDNPQYFSQTPHIIKSLYS